MLGRVVPLSHPRRMITDLMHFAARVPTVPVQRRMSVVALRAARFACPVRPMWSAIFTRAFGLVATEFPELRRAYCKFPFPHLYQYPTSVATVMVEREYRGEPAVFGLLIKDPARRSVAELTRRIATARTAPVEAVKDFRRALQLASLPRPLRRLVWWVGLNVGRQRANYFGTFGVSVYASLGAESLNLLSPLTTTLNYGPIGADGSVDVRVIFDHRVTDASTVARSLARLEQVLNGTLTAELSGRQASAVA
jgi:hypothetical protein